MTNQIEQTKEPRSLFKKRINYKPFEYPEIIAFRDAIRESYWLASEFNFDSDIQNFHTDVSEAEREQISRAMLAISQVEVGVKEFWGDFYKMFPKPEINAVGSTFAECHVEGTEMLTPTGWKDFRDLKVGDLVMQYTDAGEFEFTPILRHIATPYKGEILKLHKKSWETHITPNHRVCYWRRGKFYTTLAKWVPLDSDTRIPYSAIKVGETDDLTMMERLYIAIQADGSSRYWRNKEGERLRRGASKDCWTYQIDVKKDRKKKRLMWLLETLAEEENLTYRIYKEDSDYVHVEVDLPSGVDYKEFDWVKLEDKSYLWAQDFIQELAEWDGYRLKDKKDCRIRYSTTNKRAADMVQAVGACAGYYCNQTHYVDKRSEKFNDVYIVSFIENRETVSAGPIKVESYQYDGNVYCVTVETGYILTRYNGKTFIGGNSEERHSDAYSLLLEKLGLNEQFEKIKEYPALMGRVDYMAKFLENKMVTPSNKIRSTTLFSMFIEHISLFSQFLFIMSFNKNGNLFKGISNAIEATSKEEEIHGNFGVEIYNILREEAPELFTEELYQELRELADDAFKAELEIVEWMYAGADNQYCSKAELINYLKVRYNKAFKNLGLEPIHVIDMDLYHNVEWFDMEIVGVKENDFFNKRSTDYAKRTTNITGDDLF